MARSVQRDNLAPRLRKPSWRDPRLLIGVMLVLASIVGVVALVMAMNRTQPYFVATKDISVGQRIGAQDLSPINVRLDESAAHYLPGDRPVAEGEVALQRIPQGQLVPLSAVGHKDELDRTPVGITLDTPLPAEASEGTQVDVWVADAKPSGRGFVAPRKMISGAEIARVHSDNSALGASRGTTVHVLVTPQLVGPLVDALGNSAKVTLVPHTGGGA